MVARPMPRTCWDAAVSSSSWALHDGQLCRCSSVSCQASSVSSPSRKGVRDRGWHFFISLPGCADALEPDVVVRLLELVSRPVEVAGDRCPPGPRGARDLVVAEAAIVVEEEDGSRPKLEGAQRPRAGVVPETADDVAGERDPRRRRPPQRAL